MDLIFATTNKRKMADLQNVIKELGLSINVIGLDSPKLQWGDKEIEETGKTLEENSEIKARAVANFCETIGLNIPVIADDAGLYVEVLGNEPGIRTARYADEEIANDPTLPPYQCVYKLLQKLENETNRRAKYKCCVTCIIPGEKSFITKSESEGTIAKAMLCSPKRPYFYSIFMLEGTNVAFGELTEEELKETYRYKAIKQALIKLADYYQPENELTIIKRKGRNTI